VLAFVPDEPQLYGKLNPVEYLEFVAGLWGIAPERAAPVAEELLRFLDLADNAGDMIETFSRGMRQKLALAGALVHDPELMILDEPLTGIDAAAARQIKDLLLERVKSGKTVLLTTHVLEIAERLAQRISIVHDGRIVAQGTLDELRDRAKAANATGAPTSPLVERQWLLVVVAGRCLPHHAQRAAVLGIAAVNRVTSAAGERDAHADRSHDQRRGADDDRQCTDSDPIPHAASIAMINRAKSTAGQGTRFGRHRRSGRYTAPSRTSAAKPSSQ